MIVPTGDEIRPIGTELAPGEILDTNSLMLAAQAAEVGCEARVTDIVPDDPAPSPPRCARPPPMPTWSS